MTAIRDDAACTGAVVRKPPMKETAGGVARWRVRRYGDLTAVVTECEYNFCDMARTLRMGENTFRRPCNFKELRVVKRAHITTRNSLKLQGRRKVFSPIRKVRAISQKLYSHSVTTAVKSP